MSGAATAADLLAARLIGRAELEATLDAALARSMDRAQPAILVSGPAGIGKSRLLGHLTGQARTRGAWSLEGRAIDGGQPDAYRCLVEAISRFDATSDSQPGDQLWVAWQAAMRSLQSSAATPVAVAEELLRFFRMARRRAPLVLVLDDLQWADSDTLATLAYLCDNVDAHGALIVLAARPDQLQAEATRLIERRAVGLVEVPPLDDPAVRHLVLECLGVDAVDSALVEFILERAGGSPFAVEELVAGLARSGAIAHDGAGWRVETTRLRTMAPPTVVASIARRAAALPAMTRTVLNAAAVLGHRFDWRLLAPVTGLSEEAVTAALREAHDVGLVADSDDGMAFRHALTRDEIARTMVAPERRELARRALDRVVGSSEELTEERTLLALELAEYAADVQLRRTILLHSGLQAAERGELARAKGRLWSLVRDTDAGQDDAWIEAAVRLTELLGFTGEYAEAREVGARALDLLPDGAPQARRLAGALARAALVAGEYDVVERELAVLRGDEDPPTITLRAGLRLGQGDLVDAANLAEQVVRMGDQDVSARCEAMEILGRVARVSDVDEGAAWFEKELAEAERAGDLRWQARANHQLGTIDLFDNLRLDHLQAARRLSVEIGDPHTVAHADFHLAEALVARGETLMGRVVAERAVDLAARIGSPVLPWAWLTTARSHAYDRDDPSLEAAVDGARRSADAEHEAIEAGISGRVRALRSLFGADAVGALEHLDDAAGRLRALRGHHFPHWGLWALLRASQGALGSAEVELVRTSPGAGTRFNQALLAAGLAIVRVSPAEFAQAEAQLRGYEHAEWMVHLTRWIGLRAAHRDGWGDPVAWAQDGVRWFAEHQHEPLASSCRQFLRDVGASVPRRGRGQSQVPANLLQMGVSSREVDVLALIAMRLPNSEIASRLVLSPRTVERHVSSLLAKTGAADRGQLAQLAEDLQLG